MFFGSSCAVVDYELCPRHAAQAIRDCPNARVSKWPCGQRHASSFNHGGACSSAGHDFRVSARTASRQIGNQLSHHAFFFSNEISPDSSKSAARFGPRRPFTLNFLPRLLL